MKYRWLGVGACLWLAGGCAGAQSSALGPGGQVPGNPFAGARFYLNGDYVKKVEAAAAAAPADAALLKKVAAYPTAVWLDSIAGAQGMSRYLDEAQQQAGVSGGSGGAPTVSAAALISVFVVYDLPNRDCAAKSSGGELAVDKGGEARYRTEFIDVIAAQLKAHASQPVVLILEPDSLPNLATNLNLPRCASSDQAYRHSVAYAVSKLSLPNVSLYLDAAHAGWLGWDANRGKIATIFKEVLTEAGGADKIRGFTTNVDRKSVV
jgi:cellulose 1,4-beta-cellobiosidase